MKLFDRILYSFSRISNSYIRSLYKKTLLYAGEEKEYYYWLGISNFASLSVFFFALLLIFVLKPVGAILFYFYSVLFGGPAIISIGIYMIFYLRAEKRAREVEKALPNALLLVASNLRAGLTPYEAIKLAAIPEFGVLGEEFKRCTQISGGAGSFDKTLLSMRDRIDSSALDRTLRLFVSSMRSGGKIASLLDSLSSDISERASLKNEMMTNIKTNIMFIVFIIIIGTPVLLSISIYFVDTVIEIQEQTSFSTGDVSVGGFGGEISITSEFLIQVSYVLIFLTGLFASMFLGGIMEGDIKKGLKYSPLIIVGSYIVFFIARYMIGITLG